MKMAKKTLEELNALVNYKWFAGVMNEYFAILEDLADRWGLAPADPLQAAYAKGRHEGREAGIHEAADALAALFQRHGLDPTYGQEDPKVG
jgi:hypothetical protein